MSRALSGYVMLGVVALVWGAGPLAIGVAVGDGGGFGPLWLNGTRLLLAGVVLLGIAALRGQPVAPRGQLPLLVGLGLVGWSLGSGLQVVAQTEVASGLAALVIALSPSLALLFSATADRRVPGLAPVAGTLIGLFGVALVVLDGGTTASSLLPVLLLLVAAASWAGASVLQVRLPVRTTPTVGAAWQMMAGGGGLLVAALALGEPLPTPALSGWLAWSYLAVIGGVVGFVAWVEVLRRVPVPVAMTQPTLSTVIAVSLGHVVLGEQLGAWAPVGIPLALMGAAVTLLPLDALLGAAWARARAIQRAPRRVALAVRRVPVRR